MIDQNLNKFISIYTRVNITDENLDISSDLAINGERALTFMNEFSKEFNVDISNFDMDKYFNNKYRDSKTNRLTVGMLNRAISVGFLDDNIVLMEEHSSLLPASFTTKGIIKGVLFLIIITAFLCLIALYL